MLQLNCKIDLQIDWAAPQKVSKLIRFDVDALKKAIKATIKSTKSLIRCFKQNREVDEEANAESRENRRDTSRVRRRLEDTFGSSVVVDDVMVDGKMWRHSNSTKARL